MARDEEQPEERRLLLPREQKLGSIIHNAEAEPIISPHFSKEEQLLGHTAVGERLPYNDYTTIDWLHDHGCRVLALMGGEPLLRPQFAHKPLRRHPRRDRNAQPSGLRSTARTEVPQGNGSQQPSGVSSEKINRKP